MNIPFEKNNLYGPAERVGGVNIAYSADITLDNLKALRNYWERSEKNDWKYSTKEVGLSIRQSANSLATYFSKLTFITIIDLNVAECASCRNALIVTSREDVDAILNDIKTGSPCDCEDCRALKLRKRYSLV